MDPLNIYKGIVIPLDRANVDTDAIIPKQFLKSIKKTGFGVNLFDEWRYLDHGEPGQDNSKRVINPDFVLNLPRYKNGSILVARENFGCGSSREHAPWALLDFGIKVIIAPSFADIFYNNCFKNGILPIVLPPEEVEALMEDAKKGSNARISVDLESQTVTSSEGEVFNFKIDPFRKHCLKNGLDDIDLTLEKVTSIEKFEERASLARPWV